MLTIHRQSVQECYDWKHFYQTYLRYVRPEHSVLEIGSSTAERTESLAVHCKEFTGIEYFPERIPQSRANMRFIQGDWQKLSAIIPLQSIDIALASHVIEHVEDDLGSINQLYDVLKPGGTAILNTPNRKRLTRAIIEFCTTERKFPWWEHVREYVEDDLHALLNKSRFQIYEIKPIVLGLHGGPLYIYFRDVPSKLRNFANFWEIRLWKKEISVRDESVIGTIHELNSSAEHRS